MKGFNAIITIHTYRQLNSRILIELHMSHTTHSDTLHLVVGAMNVRNSGRNAKDGNIAGKERIADVKRWPIVREDGNLGSHLCFVSFCRECGSNFFLQRDNFEAQRTWYLRSHSDEQRR